MRGIKSIPVASANDASIADLFVELCSSAPYTGDPCILPVAVTESHGFNGQRYAYSQLHSATTAASRPVNREEVYRGASAIVN